MLVHQRVNIPTHRLSSIGGYLPSTGFDRNRPQSHGCHSQNAENLRYLGSKSYKMLHGHQRLPGKSPKGWFSQQTITSISHISWLYSRCIPMICPWYFHIFPYIATMSPSSQQQLRKRKLCVALASISGRGCDAWQWKCMAAMRCESSRSGSAGFGDQTWDDCSICSANLEAKTPRKPQKKHGRCAKRVIDS